MRSLKQCARLPKTTAEPLTTTDLALQGFCCKCSVGNYLGLGKTEDCDNALCVPSPFQLTCCWRYECEGTRRTVGLKRARTPQVREDQEPWAPHMRRFRLQHWRDCPLLAAKRAVV